jgi:hypothetical protein
MPTSSPETVPVGEKADPIAIIVAVRNIIAKAYGGPIPGDQLRPSWHLHVPWPPIGMDDIRLATMIAPINALIAQYKPGEGITVADLAKTDTVIDLTKLVTTKITGK